MPQPKEKDWLNGYKNKTPRYIVYKIPTLKHRTQTESEGLEKDIPHKQRSKGSRSSNTHIRKKYFKTKAVKEDKGEYYINIKRSADKWVRKLWYIYTMEYYSAIKKNTFESIPMRWMKLEPIIWSELSQKEKTSIQYINACIWNLDRW